jgi:ferrochelatase
MFSDPDIIRLPEAIRKNEFVNTIHQKPLAWIISTSRAPKSIANYAKIGGGTPMIKTTNEQSEAIKNELKKRGIDASTYVAMRYSEPNTS